MLSHFSVSLNSHSQHLQPASVAWETPLHSGEQQLASFMHTFMATAHFFQATETCLGTKQGGQQHKVHLPTPPTPWVTVEHHHCVHVQHWFPTDYCSGSQEPYFPWVRTQTSWKVQDEYHGLYLRDKIILFLNYYGELRFFRLMKMWWILAVRSAANFTLLLQLQRKFLQNYLLLK